MQLIALASAAALVASVAANEYNLMDTCDTSKPKAKIVNRCPYKVYLWSVLKGQGCPADSGTILDTGDFYQENYRTDGDTGVSIKISKSNKCKGDDVDITQLEYFINKDNPAYAFNFLDVSYVDCLGNNCPSRKEGFHLISGNQDGKFQTAGADKAICPVISCSNEEDCVAPLVYILPDDSSTKSCDPDADLDFYLCGSEAPGEEAPSTSEPSEPETSAAPATSSQQSEYEQPEPTSTAEKEEPSSYEAVQAAAVTPAPVVEHKKPNVWTEVKVVYATVTEYANAKRHEHAHAHAHAHRKFRA